MEVTVVRQITVEANLSELNVWKNKIALEVLCNFCYKIILEVGVPEQMLKKRQINTHN